VGLESLWGLGLNARERAKGEMGEAGVSVADRVLRKWKRDGLEGDRERERRICWIEAKPSMW
jgi:hypothetical protein